MAERIEFPTFDRVDLKSIEALAWPEAQGRCTAYCSMPGAALTPVPAVVIAQGLGGPLPAREHRYAEMLNKEGYATLVLDSFGSRGVGRLGDFGRALKVSASMMLADAMGGLRYLAGRPEIDGERIGIVGFSYGGMISVFAAYEQLRRVYFDKDGPMFKAHAALYGCSIARLDNPATTGAPILVMLGDKDTNISIERTGEIVEDLRRGGSPVTYELFEGACHQWDNDDTEPRRFPVSLKNCRAKVSRNNRISCERTGVTLGNMAGRALFMGLNMSLEGFTMLRNEDVLERSDAELKGFLERHLHRAGEPQLAVA